MLEPKTVDGQQAAELATMAQPPALGPRSRERLVHRQAFDVQFAENDPSMFLEPLI